MNKYKAQSRAAQKARRLKKMCGDKRRFESEEAAYQKGQRSYLCPHCHGWHRSGQLAELVSACRKPALVRRCNVCLQSGKVGTECKCGNWIGESSHTTETAIVEMQRRLAAHMSND